MEIIESSEAFKTVNGTFQFHCVKGIVRQDNVLYLAKWKDRRQKPFYFSQLYDVQLLETEDRGPEVRPSWMVVPAYNCYVKTPSLFVYGGAADLEKRILREVETCEVLREHPHPNIASYYGCRDTRGRVSGLCFKQYTLTLLEKVNPKHLNKSAFLSSGRPLVNYGMKPCLDGILEGIRHLHSLGLVHNDITPSNIMFDDDGTPVLIDFDSCRYVGESLRDTETKRTHEWHDPDVKTAMEKNDLDAFAELETWLFGLSADEFLFK
ncbi:serine/threonine-protein kinase [Zalerion maritima]|uniref:EKC/KEOPS complex subunit BUD32 n=1 Tax=Zalerion maritima TaxID=339359 RepID=A0AAD5REZ6_9PEZI|nr:serine/threonine-protein kinase [Zalerion maritima]